MPHVGVVGAGQLARMMWQAAVSLDLPLSVLAASAADAAVRAGAPAFFGAPDSLEALEALAKATDVLTFDHEVIPPAHLAALVERGVRLHPPPRANELAQDKAHQRSSLGALGVPVPAHRRVCDSRDLEAFGEARGWPVVAKSTRGGYDGRGVWVLDGPARAREVVAEAARRGVELLVEEHVALDRELAVLVARRPGGQSTAYPVAETVQVDGMLRELVAPARVDPAVAVRAAELAQRVAEAIGAVGILAVELFQVGPSLIVNELALRPHNSGHWSIEGCVTSQFENHLRAVVDWPLGATDPVAPAAATANLVGSCEGADPRARLREALEVPGAHVHLYGKEPRPGRKLGHVTVLADHADEALSSARRAAAILNGEGHRG